MKKDLKLISIVMPVYNAGSFLRESLDSVLSQTYKDWELICVDDGSTDNSLYILQEYSLVDSRIKVFKNKKNLGVSATTNFAIKKCSGQYLARMDADDVMVSDRLEKQITFLKRNPKVIVLGGQCELINEKGEKIGQKLFPLTHKEIYQMMYEAMPVQQPTMIVKKKRPIRPKKSIYYLDFLNTDNLLIYLMKF
jgi:glycosyltransferase involved in cell wall biosynthesis